MMPRHFVAALVGLSCVMGQVLFHQMGQHKKGRQPGSKNNRKFDDSCGLSPTDGNLNYTDSLAKFLEKKKNRNVPTVDVFFFVERSLGAKQVYFHEEKFWAVIMTVNRFSTIREQPNSGKLRSDTRIHIFSKNKEIRQKGNALGNNIYVWDSNKLHAEAQVSHFMHYKNIHFSVNPLDYEFACFERWHLFRWALEMWNEAFPTEPIERILTLDLDVLMLKNAAIFVDDVLASLSPNHLNKDEGVVAMEEYDVVLLSVGAAAVWSTSGIINFSDYIENFFEDSRAKATIAVHEGYFSDMILMRNYANEYNQTSSKCYEYSTNSIAEWKRNKGNGRLLDKLGCVPYSKDFTHLLDLSMEVTDNSVDLRIGHDTQPACFIHFQGDRSKPWIYAIAKTMMYYADQMKSTAPPPSNLRGERNENKVIGNTLSQGSEQNCNCDRPTFVRSSENSELFLMQNGQKVQIFNGDNDTLMDDLDLSLEPMRADLVELFPSVSTKDVTTFIEVFRAGVVAAKNCSCSV